MMHWPSVKGTLVPHEGKSRQSECEKAILMAPFHPSYWLAMGNTSKALSPEISEFKSELPPCHGGKWLQRAWSLMSVVYSIDKCQVSSVVSLLWTALVVGNGSYILQLIGLDLHGPTVFVRCVERYYLFINIISYWDSTYTGRSLLYNHIIILFFSISLHLIAQ